MRQAHLPKIRKGYKMNTYVIAFTLKQLGNKTDWIEHVLSSGIRENESLENLQIVDLTEYFNEVISKSTNLDEESEK